MIVPAYNEEQILKELIEDWPSVKRHAKKISAGLMKTMPKWKIGLAKDIVWGGHDPFHTKNGNTWNTSVYCMQGSKIWWSVTYAMVETGHGTKSYYYLRGMNTPHPYYVELIPHAIRRIRERYIDDKQELIYANSDVYDVCDWAVFDRHECGIFYKRGKITNGKFEPSLDKDGNIHGIAVMKNAVFYGFITPLGNFTFKTFINPDAEEGTPKFNFYGMLYCVHKTFNMPKKGETLWKTAEFLAKTYKAIPSMQPHLDLLGDKFVPLYP